MRPSPRSHPSPIPFSSQEGRVGLSLACSPCHDAVVAAVVIVWARAPLAHPPVMVPFKELLSGVQRARDDSLKSVDPSVHHCLGYRGHAMIPCGV